jgi:AcrR family transcriptional regulator
MRTSLSNKPLSTRQRILDASIKLFNEQGFQNVPAMKIAIYLGMSPGNLAYHFKTKNDIVLAVFPQLEAEIRAVVKPDGALLPSDAARHQINVFRTLWRFRFFFNSLTTLLPGDPQLQAGFLALQEMFIATVRDLFDELVAGKYMRLVGPSDTTMLAQCCWMIWLSWLRAEHLKYPRKQQATKASIDAGMQLNLAIVGPHISKTFARRMREDWNRELYGDAKGSDPA